MACSAARFTFASVTPGTLRITFSTRATHEAQCMPFTSRTATAGASGSRSALDAGAVSAGGGLGGRAGAASSFPAPAGTGAPAFSPGSPAARA